MPDLLQSFHSSDIGLLRIVAGLWGLELSSPETEAAGKELAEALLKPEWVVEMLDSLSVESFIALKVLVSAGGKLAWAAFVRQFGEIRDAGPGRRDREQVFLHPISATETLYYRALMSRAFFDTPNGPQEFAYIPDDLIQVVNSAMKSARQVEPTLPIPDSQSEPLGRPALPKEREHPVPVFDCLLDDATTLLAALRMAITIPDTSVPEEVLRSFLQVAGILVGEEPLAEEVRSFFEAPRVQALSRLRKAWKDSDSFNELHLVPGLACEGEWSNQPKMTRDFLLNLLRSIPVEKWWSLPAFIRAVKDTIPDFQRPSGDYDSWFIKRTSDSVFLRGFACWDEVDGALIRYLVTGPCYWLGMVELASTEEGGPITSFRLLKGVGRVSSIETGKLHVSSQGRVTVPRLVPRAARYQIARFCTWEEGQKIPAESRRSPPETSTARQKSQIQRDEYHYRITTGSLEKAVEQGLRINQLLGLLAKHSSVELPPAVVKALKRWELNGTEARVEVQAVLRVGKPEILEELRKSKAGRFLGESLGPVTVVVKKGAQSKVLFALTEMGLLAEYDPKEMVQDLSESRSIREHE
jgi:hypothetical protein